MAKKGNSPPRKQDKTKKSQSAKSKVKAKKPAKRRVSGCGKNWTYPEKRDCAGLILSELPCGRNEWEPFARKFAETGHANNRSADSIKNMFRNERVTKKPTGDPNQSTPERWCKKAAILMDNRKATLQLCDDESFSSGSDSGSDTGSGSESSASSSSGAGDSSSEEEQPLARRSKSVKARSQSRSAVVSRRAASTGGAGYTQEGVTCRGRSTVGAPRTADVSGPSGINTRLDHRPSFPVQSHPHSESRVHSPQPPSLALGPTSAVSPTSFAAESGLAPVSAIAISSGIPPSSGVSPTDVAAESVLVSASTVAISTGVSPTLGHALMSNVAPESGLAIAFAHRTPTHLSRTPTRVDLAPSRFTSTNETSFPLFQLTEENHPLDDPLPEFDSDAELNYSPSPVKVKKSRKSATKKSGTSKKDKVSKSSMPVASKSFKSSKRTKSMESDDDYLLTQRVGQTADELRAIPKAGEANLSDTVKKRRTMSHVIDKLSMQSPSKPDSLGHYLVQKSANDERRATQGNHRFELEMEERRAEREERRRMYDAGVEERRRIHEAELQERRLEREEKRRREQIQDEERAAKRRIEDEERAAQRKRDDEDRETRAQERMLQLQLLLRSSGSKFENAQ
ncbi:hypothetical protein HDU98_008005 [Podochytrium sp. JEL0797]|nr:hypothetical protein HDU98_008005 [Podochytrium sp. JEL0797]